MTWGSDGSVYVADGYGNSRIAKFDQKGNLVKHWGERGGQPGNFNTPHSIVSDSNGNLLFSSGHDTACTQSTVPGTRPNSPTLFAAQELAWRLDKMILGTRGPAPTTSADRSSSQN